MKLSALKFVMIRRPEYDEETLLSEYCPSEFGLEEVCAGDCSECWADPAVPKERESFNKAQGC